MIAQSEATKIFELGLREGEKRSLLAQGKFPDQRINQPGESGPYQDKTGTGKKPKTEGEKLEEKGDYIDTGEGTDSAGDLLMIEGNPIFDINPNTKTPTESEKRRQDKLRDRGASGQQGADTAKKKLKDMGIDPTALPNFLKNINPVDLLKIIPLLIGNPMQQMADAESLPQEQLMANVWGHETPSDTFNRQNYPGRGASDELRIDHMRKYHDMKKRELA